MWPIAESKSNISQRMSSAAALANSKANIGDSLESRMGNMFLGGGTDYNNGMFGYMGEYLGQSQYGGEESDPRGNATLRKALGRKSDENRQAWIKIRMSRDVYDNDGQVSSIIDLMADFAAEGIEFVHEDKSAQNFYKAWAKKTKIATKTRRVIIDLLISGTTFLYTVYAKLSPNEARQLKRYTLGKNVGDRLIVTDENGSEVLIDPKIEFDSSIRLFLDPDNKAKGEEFKKVIRDFVIAKLKSNGEKLVDKDVKPDEKNVVPWKYISLNPLQMFPSTTSASGWKYLLTKEDILKMAKTVDVKIDDTTKSLRVTLPDGMTGNIQPIKNVEAAGFYAEMEIPENRLTVIALNKYDWSNWGSPGGLVWKAMPTITFKNTLRAMEQKTAKAAINMVYLWKLGNVKEGLIPTMEDYERFADMLKAPSQTLNILWNDAISGEVIQPELKDIFDSDRWAGLRSELTSQFGITQQLVTGEGGNFAASFVSVQGLLERLESVRDLLIESWLLPEVYKVQKAMGFKKLPKVQFNQMSLRDKNAENTFIMGLYDRGIISDETLYEGIDRDVDIERQRIIEQKEFLAKNDMGRKGPFDANKEQLDMQKEQMTHDKDMQDKEFEHTKEMDKKGFEQKKVLDKQNIKLKEKQIKKMQPKGPGGRPGGKTGPQKNKRTQKPKNMARLDVEQVVKQLDSNVKSQLVISANVKDYRGLSKEHKALVTDYVGALLADISVGALSISDAMGAPIDIKATPQMNAEFSEEWINAIAEFKKTQGRRPSKDEVYSILVDSAMVVLSKEDAEDVE